MNDIVDVDIERDLCEQITAVASTGGEVEILGSGSKRFYGEAIEALPIDVSGHSGIIDYDPAELVITLRAGSRLSDVESLLAQNQQMFGFEPPHCGADATVGGMLASGLAGPRRAFAGGIRDFVLGVKMLDGRGQILQFGGRVIKNVAGFDLSRVMVGALGTLGVILEVSIRVVPLPETERTLAYAQTTADEHIRWVNELGAEPWPISGSVWESGTSRLRLSGSEAGVEHAAAKLGGDEIDFDWNRLREQQLDFFDPQLPLTRISVPPACADFAGTQAQLVEWGGAQRWLVAEVDVEALRATAAPRGGQVCAYQRHPPGTAYFQPLDSAMLKLQRNLKSSFDPAGIFNPGRIYPEL